MAMITPTEKSMKCYSRHKNHLYAETEDAFLDIVAGWYDNCGWQRTDKIATSTIITVFKLLIFDRCQKNILFPAVSRSW